jgi:hypothetical protein
MNSTPIPLVESECAMRLVVPVPPANQWHLFGLAFLAAGNSDEADGEGNHYDGDDQTDSVHNPTSQNCERIDIVYNISGEGLGQVISHDNEIFYNILIGIIHLSCFLRSLSLIHHEIHEKLTRLLIWEGRRQKFDTRYSEPNIHFGDGLGISSGVLRGIRPATRQDYH